MQEAIVSAPSLNAQAPRRFHFWMALVFALVAFGGFTPSYWQHVVSGDFAPPPIVHIHGALLFTWTLFYLAQTAWIATGRISAHRAWGLAGISLFTLLICSIVLLKITVIRLDDARGLGDASRRFAAVAICGVPLMIGMFALAIRNVARPEIHRRLMYSLMAGMLIPAFARVFLALLAPPGALDSGPPPAFFAIPPTLVAMLLIGVAMIDDRRTLGRVHKVYVWSAVAVLLTNVFAVAISGTAAWMAMARGLERLAG